jgi:diguanylate cyclase (GGDEF)-like protein
LIGFFVFAIYGHPAFFIFLIETLVFSICILVVFHYRFVRKQAEIDLQREDFWEKANILEAEIIDEKRSIDAFRSKIKNYSYLKEITEKLSMSFSLEETTNIISSEVDKVFGMKDIVVVLYLFHSKTGELRVPYLTSKPKTIDTKMTRGDIYDQWVIKTMTPLLVEDARNDFRFDINKIEDESSRLIRSLMSVPLVVEHKAVGILRLESLEENYFTTEDIRFLTTIGDIGAVAIENAQLYGRIEDLAVRDSLTGLFLRRYLEDTLAADINKQIKKNRVFSFIMIDLDKFKKYNDSYGHTAGDIVLKTLSGILFDMFKEPDSYIFRYGGEEFSVVLSDCTRDEAVKIAEDLRKRIEKITVVLRRKKTKITASIGVACAPDSAKNVEELIARADSAMYKAKKRGRNKVCAV